MILLDSNIVIYSAEPEYADLQQLVEEQGCLNRKLY